MMNKNSTSRGVLNNGANLEGACSLTIHRNNQNENNLQSSSASRDATQRLLQRVNAPRVPGPERGQNRLWKHFRETELSLLEAEFKKNDHPSTERIAHLSKILDCGKIYVVTWFIRRRQKQRKKDLTLLSDPPQPEPKRRYNRFYDSDLAILQAEFKKNEYPSTERIVRLSKVLRCEKKYIVSWFERQRTKDRKRELTLLSYAPEPEPKGSYQHFRESDLAILEAEFKKNEYLFTDRIAHLSTVLRCEKESIVKWFQRRRIKKRKSELTSLSDPRKQPDAFASTPTALRDDQTAHREKVANSIPPTSTQACSGRESTYSNSQNLQNSSASVDTTQSFLKQVPKVSRSSIQIPEERRRAERYSESELAILEEAFRANQYPSSECIAHLSIVLGCEKEAIVRWFQNRRIKKRKKELTSLWNRQQQPNAATSTPLRNDQTTHREKVANSVPPTNTQACRCRETTHTNSQQQLLNLQNSSASVDTTQSFLKEVPKDPRIPTQIPEKRTRVGRYSESELAILQEVFRANQYPSNERIAHLSIVFGRDKKNIAMWFKRRRREESEQELIMQLDPPQQRNPAASTSISSMLGQSTAEKTVANYMPATNTRACTGSSQQSTCMNTQEQPLPSSRQMQMHVVCPTGMLKFIIVGDTTQFTYQV